MDFYTRVTGDLDIFDQEEFLQKEFSLQVHLSVFFNASHRIEFEPGRYGPIHRHSYQLLVKADYLRQNKNELYVPYAEFRKILEDVAKYYDGTNLTNLPVFGNIQSTTENFVQVIAYQLNKMIAGLPLIIQEITLNESPTVGVTLSFNVDE